MKRLTAAGTALFFIPVALLFLANSSDASYFWNWQQQASAELKDLKLVLDKQTTKEMQPVPMGGFYDGPCGPSCQEHLKRYEANREKLMAENNLVMHHRFIIHGLAETCFSVRPHAYMAELTLLVNDILGPGHQDIVEEVKAGVTGLEAQAPKKGPGPRVGRPRIAVSVEKIQRSP